MALTAARFCGVALVGLTAACGSDGVDAKLADLSNVSIEVVIDSAEVGTNLVQVGFDDAADRYPDDCPILGDDFAGTFRGRVMMVRERGGKGDGACQLPTLELAATAVPSNNVVEIRDSTLTASGTYEATTLETRIATHESWMFPVGEAASLNWSHADDLLDAMPTLLLGEREIEGAANGTQIGFTIPTDVAPGPIEPVVKSNDPSPDEANRCDNAARCTATQVGNYRHEATIVAAP